MLEAEAFVAARLRSGPRVAGARHVLEMPPDAAADRIAQVFGLTGPRVTVITACSSATIAVGLAADMIASGEATCALAGGADGLSRLTYAGFNSLRVVDTEPCRPFDRRRRGMSFGEGAAILVLEDAEHARRRGVTPYATVLGHGVTDDAYHMTRPDPSGEAWERTVRAALADAGVDAAEVDYVNAHGTATEQNDAAECAAYRRALGERLAQVPVSSSKGAVGHCLCAAGAVEAAITALAVARQVAPPTVGFGEPDPACPIDPVPGQGRGMPIRVALSSSFAFGGNAAVLVFGRAT
jgi:3-oxoacyl-[acyl-carrier-protein] synthase II